MLFCWLEVSIILIKEIHYSCQSCFADSVRSGVPISVIVNVFIQVTRAIYNAYEPRIVTNPMTTLNALSEPTSGIPKKAEMVHNSRLDIFRYPSLQSPFIHIGCP